MSISIEGIRVPFILIFEYQKVCDVVCKVVSVSIEGIRVPFILLFEYQKVCDVVKKSHYRSANHHSHAE